MKLGILVNSDRNLAGIVGLSRAAVEAGHEVELFAMDTGTRLLEEQEFVGLAGLDGVAMSYCDHSAQALGVDTSRVPEQIAAGSQYNNAHMNHQSDKVLVL